MDWADALLKANPTRRGIVVSHSRSFNIDNSWTYQALYTSLKDNPNLFLMLCGHMHSSTTAPPTGRNREMTGTPSTSCRRITRSIKI